jgi:hypothetical protein
VAEGRPTARQLWVLVESVHAVTYFAPECRLARRELGLKGFWAGYFAARAAPLGAVGAGPVVAAFFNFHPVMVQKAIPASWDVVEPGRLTIDRAAAAAAARALHARCTPDVVDEMASALPTLRAASARCPSDGRVMASANQAVWPRLDAGLRRGDLPEAEMALAELWQYCTTLREHRGDGHVAALLTHGLSGLEAHLLAAATLGLDPTVRRDNRGWTGAAWDAAGGRLAGRDLLGADGGATEAGHVLRQSVETMTDDLAETAFAEFGDGELAALAGALRAGAQQIQSSGVLPFPNPMGLPAL